MMKRQSNLAFNREFPVKTGLSGIPRDSGVQLRMDTANQFDPDAVGIFLDKVEVVMGWLYRKDNNRAAVISKLRCGGEITGHIELVDGKKVVIFWL